jgi:hypothetical protein
MTKKNFVAGLAIAAVALPVFASAATVEELQAQINALMAQLSASKPAATASCTASFTKTLKQGMTDAEVMDLQKVLNSNVATQVSATGVGSKGNETNYFGSATKAAVVKFQDMYAMEILTPAGLSKGTGMVGAATRAKLNASCGTPATTPTTPGTTPVTGLQGGAGSLDIVSATADVEDDVVTGDSKIVLSFKGTATGSDTKVSHLKLSLGQSGTGSNQLNRYFTKFDVMLGTTKVGSVDTADFTRDAAGQYSKTITLTDAIVKMGLSNKATFYVKATGVSTIDSFDAANTTWTATSTEARYVDATGVTLSEQFSASNAGIYVKKLASSADVKVKYSTGAANPDTKTVFVSEDNSGDKVTMNEFKIKAEGTAMSFDKLTVAATPVNVEIKNAVSEFQLVKGTEVLATVDAAAMTGAQAVVFNLDTTATIAQDATETYKIVARMLKINVGTTTPSAAGFQNGDTLVVSFTSANVQDKNGDNVTAISGSADGKVQTFRATGLNVAKVSSVNTVSTNSQVASSSYAEFKMQVKVTASGDDIWVPLNVAINDTTKGMNIVVLDSNSTTTFAGTPSASVSHISGGTKETNSVKIADGDSATFELVVVVDPTAAGQYRLQVNGVGYAASDAVAATSNIAATPVADYQSSLSYIAN